MRRTAISLKSPVVPTSSRSFPDQYVNVVQTLSCRLFYIRVLDCFFRMNSGVFKKQENQTDNEFHCWHMNDTAVLYLFMYGLFNNAFQLLRLYSVE
jgi:hypothetical protein